MAERASRMTRRSRTLIGALLVLSLFGTFAGTCAGGDTPEVQKPVSETKMRYEEFFSQIGVLGNMGIVGAPWVVAPEADSELSGSFTIHGWSARPSDVSGLEDETTAYVRLFCVPATIYEETGEFLGYELTSVSRVAPVNLTTGDWTLEATSLTDTFEGECVIVAVTHIGGVDGPESAPTAVWVKSADGASKTSGEAWPAAEVTVYLATVMVQPKDETFKSGAKDQLAGLIDDVKRYYRDASRGRVKVEVIYEVGVKTIDKTDAELESDDDAYTAHIKDAVAWIPKDKRPPAGAVFALLAAQPGGDGRNESPEGRAPHSISWVHLDVGVDKKTPGSFINLPLDQGESQDMVGVIAHEIAHGLGSVPGTQKTALPDLYENPKDNYTPADFNNFDIAGLFDGISAGNYFLMANNRAVNPCAYSQEWLGWLDYSDITLDSLDARPASVRVPYLDGLLGPVKTVPRIVWNEGDGRESFTVVEARTNTRGSWDSKLDASGIVVYKVRTAKPGERQGGQEGWPRSINWCTLIDSDTSDYYDLAEGFIIRRSGDMTGGAAETVDITAAVSIGDVVTGLKNMLIGAVMRTGIPTLVPGTSCPANIRSTETSASAAPDLDLHAYLADGTHIGVNYDTGEYENPVSGARASGDMVLDSEWIVLPEALSEGARFEISSHDAKVFAEQHPEAVPQGGLELAYEIQPTVLDEATDGIARGESQKGTLKPGDAASTSLDSGNDLRFAPLAPGGGGPTGLDAVDPIIWQLGAAGVLVMIGLIVLLWPARKKR